MIQAPILANYKIKITAVVQDGGHSQLKYPIISIKCDLVDTFS